jgi:hypothetical protein
VSRRAPYAGSTRPYMFYGVPECVAIQVSWLVAGAPTLKRVRLKSNLQVKLVTISHMLSFSHPFQSLGSRISSVPLPSCSFSRKYSLHGSRLEPSPRRLDQSCDSVLYQRHQPRWAEFRASSLARRLELALFSIFPAILQPEDKVYRTRSDELQEHFISTTTHKSR